MTRSLVLVVGSGRSGTSVFSGILQRLGYHVPQPEVAPDETNPRGFAESQWVVDLHVRLLKAARVQTSDARPDAWAAAAEVAGDRVALEVRAFLRKQFALSDYVLVKDPRLVWFLPLWRRVALELHVEPRFVTVLRHPAEVVQSKSRYYGTWQGDVSRTAGWVNTMLHAERATREGSRAFVSYTALLDDWTRTLAGAAERLELPAVATASSGQIRAADAFVDPTLRRVPASWQIPDLPDELRGQAEHVWGLLTKLADAGELTDDLMQQFDLARESYVRYYRQVEAVAQSSVTAAVKSGQPRTTARLETWVARKVPDRYRRRIPLRWRKLILTALGRGGRR